MPTHVAPPWDDTKICQKICEIAFEAVICEARIHKDWGLFAHTQIMEVTEPSYSQRFKWNDDTHDLPYSRTTKNIFGYSVRSIFLTKNANHSRVTLSSVFYTHQITLCSGEDAIVMVNLSLTQKLLQAIILYFYKQLSSSFRSLLWYQMSLVSQVPHVFGGWRR